MKKLLLSVSLLLLSLAATAQEGTWVDVNETNFPDETFRNILKAHPLYYDAENEKIRVDLITSFGSSKLNESNQATYGGCIGGTTGPRSIKSLKGIEFFTNIWSLTCSWNPIQGTLDLTQNTQLKELNCSQGKLDTLLLSGLSILRTVYCQQNNLTKLDLTGATIINTLQCHFNQLSTLDLTTNTNIRTLYCNYNKFETLDVSPCTNLYELDCGGQDPRMTTLLFPPGNGRTMRDLQCYSNDLTSEMLETAFAGIYILQLNLRDNPLSPTIDLSEQTKLTMLLCDDCELESLTVNSPVLGTLTCKTNNLTTTSLDLSAVNDESLYTLQIDYNPLIKDLKVNNINTSRFSNLSELTCRNCGLLDLNVVNNTMLKKLNCRDNKIKELDLTNNLLLSDLNCMVNELVYLDLSANTALTQLDVSNNRLRYLDLSNNAKLTSFTGRYQLFYDNLVVLGDNRDKLGFYISPEDDETVSLEKICSDYNYPTTTVGKVQIGGFGKEPVTIPEIINQDGKKYLVLYSHTGTLDVDMNGKQFWYAYFHGAPKISATSTLSTSSTSNQSPYIYPYVMYANPASEDKQDHFLSGTLYVDYDAVVPENTEAWIVLGTNNPTTITKNGTDVTFDQLTMKKVGEAGDVIPANTPIYVKVKIVDNAEKAQAGLYAFNKAGIADSWNDAPYTCVEIPEGNLLQGITTDTKFNAQEILVLGREQVIGTGQVGFWYYTGGTLKAHRCYLPTSILSTANTAKGAIFNFNDENASTTNITTLHDQHPTHYTQQWYTLSGVRLNGKPIQKGVYIHNGRKEVIR